MLNKEQIEQILKLRKQDWSYAKISQKVNCSKNTVKKYCQQLINMQSPSSSKSKEQREIQDRKAKTKTLLLQKSIEEDHIQGVISDKQVYVGDIRDLKNRKSLRQYLDDYDFIHDMCYDNGVEIECLGKTVDLIMENLNKFLYQQCQKCGSKKTFFLTVCANCGNDVGVHFEGSLKKIEVEDFI